MKHARRDLCGGCSAMGIPTAIACEWSQRSGFTMVNTLVLAPNVVSGEVDVFPAER